MIIKEWPASTNPPDIPGMLVKVSHAEALALIRSLAAQMVEGSANAGRHEGTATRGMRRSTSPCRLCRKRLSASGTRRRRATCDTMPC